MKKCVIFGAGTYDGAVPPDKADLYIAADAGLEKMNEVGLSPDLIVGDLDSLSGGLPEDIPLIRLPVEKDVTDLDAAVTEGLRRGCDDFYLFGVLGGRPDHSLANLSLAARLANEGKRVFLYGSGFLITAIRNGTLRIPARERGAAAVFSFTDKSEGVSIKGLKYELENAELTSDFALGVSNSFDGREVIISVKKGTLIIMYENT